MNITSKIFLLVLFLLGLSLPLAHRAHAMAQISLQNNTNLWLNLYIDGNFGCGPVMPSGFCTSSVTPGSHLLEARKRGEPGTTIPPESVNIGDGTSPTWTVNYTDPLQDLIKKINGRRYTYMHMNNQVVLTLDVKGKFLIEGNIRPNFIDGQKVSEPGYNEISSFEITGREFSVPSDSNVKALLQENGLPWVELFTYTISEDGDSISVLVQYSNGTKNIRNYVWQR